MAHQWIFILLCLASTQIRGQQGEVKTDVSLTFEESYSVPGVSIRAIEVDKDGNLWFAGSTGRFGKISDQNLQLDSLSYHGKSPSFRALAITDKNAFALSIENPALLYKLPEPGRGKSPTLVYKEEHPEVFYDSMTFLNPDLGIAMGDPIDGCLSILVSNDGGQTWLKKPCSALPSTFAGEAGFAASDTNIAVHGTHVWIGTGGTKARVFHSPDGGGSWEVYDTPLIKGGAMTGIYSLDFADQLHGIAMGGNWEKKDDFKQTKAITQDGGKTWSLIANGDLPGYISCAQYVPKSQGKELIACSTEGIYFSGDRGHRWIKLSEKGFYALRFVDKQNFWVSGNNEIAKVKITRN